MQQVYNCTPCPKDLGDTLACGLRHPFLGNMSRPIKSAPGRGGMRKNVLLIDASIGQKTHAKLETLYLRTNSAIGGSSQGDIIRIKTEYLYDHRTYCLPSFWRLKVGS